MSHPSESRDLLIRAARTVFALKGFDGATVKDIAEAAHLNVSLVSYHFGGKEGLYNACLEAFGRSRLEAARRVLTPAVSAEDLVVRLRVFAEEFIECHLEEPEITAILHRECWMDREASRSLFKETFLQAFETLRSFFDTAHTRGILAKPVDPLLASGLFFGSLIHLIRSDAVAQAAYGLSLRDPVFRERAISQALICITQGILNPTHRQETGSSR